MNRIRGTLSPFGATANLEGIKSPLKEAKSPFEITGGEIPAKSSTFNAERLVMRPAFKTRRIKFDVTKTECMNQKNNDPMTM